MEFFCAPEKFKALKAAASDFPSLTYMAVNSKGDFASNQVSCLTPCLVGFFQMRNSKKPEHLLLSASMAVNSKGNFASKHVLELHRRAACSGCPHECAP